MKKIDLSIITIAVMCLFCFSLDGYSQKKSEPYSKEAVKKRRKMARSKIKELKKDGWKIDGSKTLEIALSDHYDKLEVENSQELVSDATCKSIGVCKEKMFDDACRNYASYANSFVKGRVTSDKNTDQSDLKANAEFDKMYAAYERLVAKNIKGEVKPSLTIYKENEGIKQYRTFYVVNEDEAAKARLNAIKQASEETKVAQEYAKKISDFVNEGFLVPEETK